jgi:hypothetical protein
MRTQSTDTHPDAERVQIERLRQMTVAQRAELMWSLSAMAIRLSRRALRRANPDATEDEISVLFVELHYGRDLAERFREHLATRLSDRS